MTEKPMLMNGEMVRAILDGRKVQSRRPIEPQPPADYEWDGWLISTTGNQKRVGCAEWKPGDSILDSEIISVKPRYEIGDYVWVKETWGLGALEITPWDHAAYIGYRADGIPKPIDYKICTRISLTSKLDLRADPGIWRPSIHMPKWASRITLEIIGVRVERLWEITEDDAKAEGITSYVEQTPGMHHSEPRRIYPAFRDKEGGFSSAKEAYEALWDSIYGKKYPSDSNPWLFAYTFKRIKP